MIGFLFSFLFFPVMKEELGTVIHEWITLMMVNRKERQDHSICTICIMVATATTGFTELAGEWKFQARTRRWVPRKFGVKTCTTTCHLYREHESSVDNSMHDDLLAMNAVLYNVCISDF